MRWFGGVNPPSPPCQNGPLAPLRFSKIFFWKESMLDTWILAPLPLDAWMEIPFIFPPPSVFVFFFRGKCLAYGQQRIFLQGFLATGPSFRGPLNVPSPFWLACCFLGKEVFSVPPPPTVNLPSPPPPGPPGPFFFFSLPSVFVAAFGSGWGTFFFSGSPTDGGVFFFCFLTNNRTSPPPLTFGIPPFHPPRFLSRKGTAKTLLDHVFSYTGFPPSTPRQ